MTALFAQNRGAYFCGLLATLLALVVPLPLLMESGDLSLVALQYLCAAVMSAGMVAAVYLFAVVPAWKPSAQFHD